MRSFTPSDRQSGSVWRGGGTWRGLAGAALLCGLAACGPSPRNGEGKSLVIPERHWAWKEPGRAGFSRKQLEALSRKVGGTGCVVHGGKMIYEWGDPTACNDAASSTKAFYTYLVFKAIETGRIGSLEDRVVKWMPALGELNAERGYKDREITFHHLLSQTSGYGLEEKPGEAFAYNDFATGLLSWILFHRVYGLPRGEDDRAINGEELGEILRFEHRPTVRHRNSRPRRLRISVRDQARFVLLHLRGGRWGDRQLLSEALFAMEMGYCVPSDLPRTTGREAEHLEQVESFGGGLDLKNHLGCLGYYWWHNRISPDGRRFLPDAPPGTFMGSGYGGRFAMIGIPELDLAVVWQDIYRGEDWTPLSEVGRFKVNEVIRELLQARIRATP